jgi:hypothetical protein
LKQTWQGVDQRNDPFTSASDRRNRAVFALILAVIGFYLLIDAGKAQNEHSLAEVFFSGIFAVAVFLLNRTIFAIIFFLLAAVFVICCLVSGSPALVCEVIGGAVIGCIIYYLRKIANK